MYQFFELLDMNLRLFDGAAGGAGGTASSGGDGGGSAEGVGSSASTVNTQVETKRNGSNRHSSKKTGDANVVYGKQEANTTDLDAGGKSESDITVTSNTLTDKKAAFEELISGEYKDEFTQRTQNIIDRRFKETKNLEAQVKSQQPLIDMLFAKYKIDDGDINKLTKAIDSDDTYWEGAAEEAGLTVEQYKTVQKLQRENEAFKAQMRAQEGQRQAAAQINKWSQEAEALKATYPNFDFKAELTDRNFVQMLKSGIPVKTAYEVKYIDDIKSNEARSAAQKAEQNTVAKIKNKASRPSENGTSSVSTAIIKDDVSKLTRADRARIAKEVERGKTIIF